MSRTCYYPFGEGVHLLTSHLNNAAVVAPSLHICVHSAVLAWYNNYINKDEGLEGYSGSSCFQLWCPCLWSGSGCAGR